MQYTTMPYSFFSNFHFYNTDDDDNIWVPTFGRLYVYEPKTLRELRTVDIDPDAYLLQGANLKGLGIMCFYYSTGVRLFDYKRNLEYKLSLSNKLISNLNPTILYANISQANNLLFAGAELGVLQYIPLNSVIGVKPPRACYLSGIQVYNRPYATDTLPEYLHSLRLSHHNNFLTLTFSSTEFSHQEDLEYRYRLSGVDKEWVYSNYLNRTISYQSLSPGKYRFYVSIRNEDGSWNDSNISLSVIITPAWWQTNGFKILAFVIVAALVLLIGRKRAQDIRNKEQQKSLHEKKLMELEAKALRAQMNPHFVFNCLNSIKSLIQQNENEKAATYLTTFSKLIRTLFNNADKKEISLYDEIETCKLYLQLEAMRFDDRFSFAVNVDNTIDTKSIQVPALIIQPFIENAIWHGIVPGNGGGHVSLNVLRKIGTIEIVIDDNGIGRGAANKNKPIGGFSHESKGVNLTQSRLELNNLLQQRQAKLEVIDKEDEKGMATGTTVIIEIGQEL